MPGTCHQLFNLDNYSPFVSSTLIQSEIHLPVLTHRFSAAVFHQPALSRVSEMTGLLSIPPVYLVIPIIFAENTVSGIRNVGETCSNAPVNWVPGRTWKQNPGVPGRFPCHDLGFLPITPAPADGLSCRALGTGSRGLHSSHHCADMGIRKMSATALGGGWINQCAWIIEPLCCKTNGLWSVNHIKKHLPDLMALFLSTKSACRFINRTSVKIWGNYSLE